MCWLNVPGTYDMNTIVKDVVLGIVASQDNGVSEAGNGGAASRFLPGTDSLGHGQITPPLPGKSTQGWHPATTEWYGVATSTYGYPYHAIAFRCNGQWVKNARFAGGATLMSKEDAKRWARVFKQLTGSS